ncbi:hypothetical protein N7516_003676 [Penicillium verrucosum]|uniref:uncharacterized protein n=1 Tax=Penicillium verrucosum TaxID=60171 RepID=UPI0025451734|nr:uncharacterized protein N7516_003676 [Penicillium verrucosum]KAJ5943508.1 hypothetical protein N7516_003676 [Penicillium verrucosum]
MGAEGPESSYAAWEFPGETPIPFLHSFNLPPSESMTLCPSGLRRPYPPKTKQEATTSTQWQLSLEWRSLVPMHVKFFRSVNQMISRAHHRSLGLTLDSRVKSHFRPVSFGTRGGCALLDCVISLLGVQGLIHLTWMVAFSKWDTRNRILGRDG